MILILELADKDFKTTVINMIEIVEEKMTQVTLLLSPLGDIFMQSSSMWKIFYLAYFLCLFILHALEKNVCSPVLIVVFCTCRLCHVCSELDMFIDFSWLFCWDKELFEFG